MPDSFLCGGIELNDNVTSIVIGFAPGELKPTTEYVAWLAAVNPEFAYGFPMWENPVTSLSLLVKGATPADVQANVAARLACVCAGQAFSYTRLTRGITTSAHIIAVVASDPDFNPTDDGAATVTFAITTRPGWVSSVATTTTGTIADGWGTFDVLAGGDMPSSLSLKATNPVAATLMALGLMPGAAAAFSPLDDYSGTADAAAVGGARSVDAAMTSAYASLATAPNLDAGANRGLAEGFARVRHTAVAPGNVTYRTQMSVTGSGVATVVSDFGPETVATAATGAEEVRALGKVPTPVGAVPGIDTGAGYGTVGELVTQKTGTTEVVVPGGGMYQTLSLVAGQRITGLTLKGHRHGAEQIFLALWNPAGVSMREADSTAMPMTTSAEFYAPFSMPYVVPASGTWSIGIWATTGSPVLCKSTTNPYAGGALDGTGSDLYFAVLGQTPLGFVCTTTVRAKVATETGKVASVDALMRVPCDHGYLHTWHAFAASGGILAELDTRGEAVYETASADGTAGPSLLGEADMRGSLRPRPGVNTYVLVCGCADVAPGDVTWSATVSDVWSDPTRA